MNHLTLDGADWRNTVTGGTLAQPSLSSLQETHITTAGATADNGASVAPSLQLTSRAGTNSWRGAAQWMWRGKSLSGLPATFERGLDVPALGRQQWTGALGGPIVRDRLFWFGALEHRRQNVWQQVGVRDTAAQRIRTGLVSLPSQSTTSLLRLDWQATDRHNLKLLYAGERGNGRSLPVLQRTLGTATQQQHYGERFDQGWFTHSWVPTPTLVNEVKFGFNDFHNASRAARELMQRNYPNLQDGAPFRVPALPRQRRWQFSESLSWVKGTHAVRFGGEMQRLAAEYAPGFARAGLLEFAEDFASADRNGDGRTDDRDLLVNVALRDIGAAAGHSVGLNDKRWLAFAQDDWRMRRNLTLNFGARWQMATNEKNLGYVNSLTRAFLTGERRHDANNLAPRTGFAWALDDEQLVVRGSYGWFYDAIPLHYAALEKTLDGRQTVIAATNGKGQPIIWPNAPGIHTLSNALQNPAMQTSNLEITRQLGNAVVVRADFTHSLGTHFLLARSVGSFGNQSVIQLESSAKTKYDALTLAVERRWQNRWEMRGSYTLSKAFNYTNGDQLPFFTGVADANDLRLEYGPSPIDQRHRFNFVTNADLWRGWRVAAIWTMASGVPMDILLPDASARLPYLQRNAGGRLFRTAAELNRFLANTHPALPRVRDDARFHDGFSNFDLRVAKRFEFGDAKLELGADVFNLFNVSNVFGLSNVNYSGFGHVLGAGFGRPVTTAGGWFTAGGPRGVQAMMKLSF